MIKGLHIELTNKCTLKCPRCSRTEFIKQFPKKWKNIDININDLLKFIDIDLTGIMINLCGNYGDPIYHDGLPGLVKELKNRKAIINIATNGSYRSRKWWAELTESLTENDQITFAIDGIPDNFTKYRINADWESMQEGIRIVSESRSKMIWQYILFSYNQTDVKKALRLSKDLGFDEFFTMDSGRWDNGTEWLMPTIDDVSESKQKWKSGDAIEIDPKCQDGNQHYISADGFYSPCCWMSEHRFYYKSEFFKDRKAYDITKNTLSEILNRDHVIEFYRTIEERNLDVCQFSCPRIA